MLCLLPLPIFLIGKRWANSPVEKGALGRHGGAGGRVAGQVGAGSGTGPDRAVAVTPSLIRVEADEVTYNLHIMLRFELEQAMVEGRVSVADLPDLWNAKMEDYLGLRPETDAEGVLQDIHWSLGALGYFPTYTLGNLMSAQLFDQANKDLPGLEAQIAAGQFAGLLGWLRTNIHQYGRKLQALEILERVTGAGLDAGPWLAYIRQKYGAIYGGF